MSFASPLFRLGASAALFALLVACELAWPLRASTRPKWQRVAVNLGMAAASGAVVILLYGAIVGGTASYVREHRLGLMNWIWSGASHSKRLVGSILLLDYSLWLWHLLNHRVPFLWRFHAAHHADLDLDASTALRFHFGEIALSIPFRAAQVALLGVAFADLLAWEALLFAAILFHHSNLRLPERVDAFLRRFFMTPSLHGIHHSIVPSEVNTNFGTMLTVWDHVHRTYLEGVPQEQITIGVPEERAPGLGLLDSLALPFRRACPKRPPFPPRV